MPEPESTKPDWKSLVLDRLTPQHDDQSVGEETIAELAAHLEDVYEAAEARGQDRTASLKFASQEIQDWHVLWAEIRQAKFTEGSMNVRTKSLWLPALASLFASSLFLFVLTEMSLQPKLLVRLNSGAALSLYLLWIIGQIACGALGAFLSLRVGGSRPARLVAGAFPAIVMLFICGIVIPLSALLEHNEFIFHDAGRLCLGVSLWVVVPAVTLLLGAAPFLRESVACPTSTRRA